MATVKFNDGGQGVLKPSAALVIWEILNNEREATDEQDAYCEKITHLYLNWRKAPDSYVQANLEAIVPMAIDTWLVDRYGKPTRPWGEFDWTFAKRWGLWENGHYSVLVTRAIKQR